MSPDVTRSGNHTDSCDELTIRHTQVVDRAILHLVDSVTFTGADFSIQHDGVCRLNPELARRVAQLAIDRTNSIEAELLGPDR